MGNKSWRITDESEFYQKANVYVEKHLERFIENLDESIRSRSKKIDIKKKYRAYRNNLENSIYANKIRIKLEDMMEIVLEDVEDWSKFSMNVESSPDEIMLRLIINNIFNCSYVSNLLISTNPNLSEDFIEDCIYVSSDLFKFSEWDDEHVDAVSSAAAQCVPENLSESLLELYDKKRLSDLTIPIRLNLKEICCINKDPIFMTKYYSYLNQIDIEKKKGRFKH